MLADHERTDQITDEGPGVDVGAVETTPTKAAALIRYQDLFTNMAEGVVFQDEAGRIIDANPAALQLLGVTMEQLLGLTSFDPRWRAIHLDGTEVPGATHPAVVALRTGQAVRDAIMGIFIPLEERYRWLRVNAIPQMIPGRERPAGVFVTFDDITGWDYLEEAARLQEARYQALLEQAADAIFVADLEGRYIEVNPAACALLGYTREELLGKRIVDMIPPEDAPRLEAARENLLQGSADRGEWRMRRKDGLLTLVEVSARIMPDGRWQAIVRDITERKQMEAELRQAERESAAAEARFRAVIEQAPDAMIITDSRGRILLLNRQTEMLFGYARDTLIGQPVERLIPKRLHTLHRLHRATFSAHPQVRPMGIKRELFGQRADGVEFPIEVTLGPISTDGEIRIIATCRDMTERKRLERALREQSEQLMRTFEAMNEGVYIYARDGELVQMNATARALAGYDVHPELEREPARNRGSRLQLRDVTGRPMSPEEWPARRVLRGETITGAAPIEMTVRSAAGRDLIQHATGAPLRDTEGRIVGAVIVTHDVTEQRRLEHELAAHAQEIEAIFQSNVDGIMFFDMSGRIIHMNPALRRVFGFTATGQIQGLTVADLSQQFDIRDVQGQPLAREEKASYRILHGETLTGQESVDRRLRAADGSEIWVSFRGAPVFDQQGQIVGGVMSIRDETERRLLERELAARAQEIETIFETDADAVMLFDTKGQTIRMNAAQRHLLGYDATGQREYVSAEERARRYVFWDPQGQPLPQEDWPIYRVLRGESLVGSQAVEMRMRTLDGRDLQVSVSGAPVHDQQGRIIGGVTSSRDVTEQRRLEQQRNDILSVVAHDLANPLTAIRMFLQMQQRSIERGQAPLTPDAEVLASMTYAVGRMERLLGDMRLAVGLEANELVLDRKPCDLVALCHQEVQSIRVAEAREVRVNLPDAPVMIDADGDRIGQVIANLLSNADKYSPVERPITLTLRVELAAPDSGDTSAQQARILVQDEGPGIAPKEQGRIWERFHRVAGVHPRPGMGGSLGLGLYISHEIITRHGGTMGVESAPGEGSTFWFTLPLVPPA